MKANSSKELGNPSLQAKFASLSKLKQQIENSVCETEWKHFTKLISHIEDTIAEETAEVNREKIKEYISSAETLEGNFCQTNFWKLKQ